MREYDKFRSDLDAWVARNGGRSTQEMNYEELRRLYFRLLGTLPDELLSDFFTTFLDRFRADGEASRLAAVAWLGATAGILTGEYDGSPLSRDEWVDIRETVSANAGILDVDLLTEIMSLVLENGAL